jgi:hypothetical protein
MRRQHHRAEHQREPEALQLEVQPGEGVSHHRAGDQVADDADRRDNERIDEELAPALLIKYIQWWQAVLVLGHKGNG